MIIVSDTTPIHYLILIRKESILPTLFSEILIPEAVAIEMRHPNAPKAVREWINDPPNWVKFRSPRSASSSTISGLGRGETAAIAVALEEKADFVLMDDRKAIREARNNDLTVLTTFAVLELAAIRGLIDLEVVLDELSQTSFRMPPDEIVEEYLRRHKERTATSN